MVPQWAVRQLSSIITAASEKNSSETDINVPTTLGELNAVSMPEEVVENWFLLLRVLHNLGHFESKDTARQVQCMLPVATDVHAEIVCMRPVNDCSLMSG